MADLSLDTAASLVAGTPPSSSISEVREKVAEIHSDHPQRSALVAAALDEIEAALGRLAALGHRFFLSESDPSPTQDFPVMLYKDGAEATAGSKEEVDSLTTEGWAPHPSLQIEAPAGPVPKSGQSSSTTISE